MPIRRALLASILAALIALLAGCAGGAWRTARSEDSLAGYYRFLRDHPDSRYAASARERLAYQKLRRSPSLEAFSEFRRNNPDSELLDELLPIIEEKAFVDAQAGGTAEDFDRFAVEFAGGEMAARAIGNATYLRAAGFEGDVDALLRFSEQHPGSDFAAEARRSAEAADLRPRTRVKRVGLSVEIPSTNPEADRLRRTFIEAVRKAYAESSVTLVPGGGADPSGPGVDGLLRIRHSETRTAAERTGANLSASAVEARTIVTLELMGRETPAWQREFGLRVDARDHETGRSLLFGARAANYWNEFFVPLASWASDAALRPQMHLDRRATGVDALGDRAVVAFEDGSFDVVRLADPLQPVRVATYRPDSRMESRDGVRIVGNRVILFGEDGLQAIRFGPNGPGAEFELGRGTVGDVSSVEPMGSDFVVAGSQGLLWVRGDGSGTKRLMSRRLHSVAGLGDLLVATDGESMYAATPRQFSEGRVASQLRLPVGFQARRIRSFGKVVVVLGAGGALVLDYATLQQPRLLQQLYSSTVGDLVDAARVGTRVFLLGPRGLLVMTPGMNALEEALDVHPSDSLVAMGRHLVALGSDTLQVIDTSPYAQGSRSSTSRPASPAAKVTRPRSSAADGVISRRVEQVRAPGAVAPPASEAMPEAEAGSGNIESEGWRIR